MPDVLHPASYAVDHLLSCVQAKFVDAILRLRTRVMQSSDGLLNLGILRMRNTILRLDKFSDCAEHIHLSYTPFPIRESVDSLCSDGADVQYMQYLSKSRITSPQTRQKLI